MKTRSFMMLFAVLGLTPAYANQPTRRGELIHQAPHPVPTAACQWLDITLEASGRDVERVGARPTILARAMAIVLTSMYDAWAAYDDQAVGTRLGEKLRQPPAQRTRLNKEAAIAYAAFRALLFVYPDDAEWIRGRMKGLGFNPDNRTIKVFQLHEDRPYEIGPADVLDGGEVLPGFRCEAADLFPKRTADDA